MRFESLLERHEGGALSQGEAAAMLGISERTFRRLPARDRRRPAPGARRPPAGLRIRRPSVSCLARAAIRCRTAIRRQHREAS